MHRRRRSRRKLQYVWWEGDSSQVPQPIIKKRKFSETDLVDDDNEKEEEVEPLQKTSRFLFESKEHTPLCVSCKNTFCDFVEQSIRQTGKLDLNQILHTLVPPSWRSEEDCCPFSPNYKEVPYTHKIG